MIRTVLLFLLALGLPLGAAEPVLRVVTFNIHHGRGTDGKIDLERVARTLQALKPDVVALQEVDRDTKRSGGVDQLQRLAELTGWNSAFGQTMPYDGGRYGNAILSRFPISEQTNHPLPVHEGQEPRAALMVTVTPGRDLPAFRFVSTHFSHDRADARLDQAGHLLTRCRGVTVPLLIGADFNAKPTSAPMQRFWKAGFVDQVHPQSEIDYILTRKDDRWERQEVLVVEDLVTSDHRPVLVTLRRGGEQ